MPILESENQLFSTFIISENVYGLDVISVQEVTRALPITQVPLTPNYVIGLINLRGQLATAVGLRQLFQLKNADNPKELMNVVCKADGILLSLLVDEIGDVLELEKELYEPIPDTLPESISRYMSGIYKTPKTLVSILDINKIAQIIHEKTQKGTA
jgi:purine-binding chemotaxis protein CheW